MDQVFFLHIPKTGGTSFTALLSNLLPAHQVYETADNEAFLHEVPKIRAASVVSGHQFYPFRHVLSGSVTVLTFLREPVDRVRSAYWYVARTADHPLHARLAQRDIRAFLFNADLRFHTENLQTRMLGAEYPLQDIADRFLDGSLSLADAEQRIRLYERVPCDESILRRAMHRLESCVSFGLMGRYEESVVRLLGDIGLMTPPPELPHLKAASTQPPPLRPGEETAIRAANVYDLKLYEFAEKLFHSRVLQL